MGLGQSALLVFLPLLVELTALGYSQWAQLFAVGMATYVMGSLAWPLLLMLLKTLVNAQKELHLIMTTRLILQH